MASSCPLDSCIFPTIINLVAHSLIKYTLLLLQTFGISMYGYTVKISSEFPKSSLFTASELVNMRFEESLIKSKIL